MQIRFLLGPAGSGKTYQCLAEIREALRKQPEGPPLILLAPKQATFQLERQLLSDPELEGYTRLRILSFERLAEFVFADLGTTPPALLSDVGRLMVFRALLAQKHKDLKLFHATALLPGFARQVSQQIREFQRHGLTPAAVACLAGQGGLRPELQSKLQDLALLFEVYFSWNSEHQLKDLYCLPDLAAEVLNKTPANAKDNSGTARACELGGLWLDGFAEMTRQELNLLAAILPRCEQATLAFCLDAAAAKAGRAESWLSPWSTLRATFEECRERLMTVPGSTCSVEMLPRDRKRSRFSTSPVLAHLEKYWGDVTPFEKHDVATIGESLQIVACANPDGESTHAAREILRFVRMGGRYREAAVIVRDLESFQEPVARALRQFEIPFFVDQRQPAAHHPVAELTRCALRTVLFDWQHEDWFGALKTGLLPADEAELDWLENEALARGWKGQAWQAPLRIEGKLDLEKRLESLRKKVVAPLARFQTRMLGHSARPNGAQLAECIHGLWADLDIESQLERSDSVDATVWDQMNEWLDMLATAFSNNAMPLREWLPILEAGLADLTVGVIPPALDQVLVGAIDRSRNPDLKLALLLGMNESVFPAPPTADTLLTDADRDELDSRLQPRLGPGVRQRLARENYYGYVALTRPRNRLVVSYSEQNDDGRALNPSPFLSRLERLFPGLKPEVFSATQDWPNSEHVNELIPALLSGQAAIPPDLESLPRIGPVLAKWRQWQTTPPLNALALSPAAVQALYGTELRSSVSALEQFAACPFQFFVNYGLRAGERKLFEADPRQTGSFQHEILSRFHLDLQKDSKRWRDISPREARDRVAKIGKELGPAFAGGLFNADAKSRFMAAQLLEQLQNFIEVVVGWMSQYQFDPREVELTFGLEPGILPAWRVDLGNGRALLLRGKIDRVDTCPLPGSNRALAVVMDYKSSPRKIDDVLLQHGLELQLLSYLAALRQAPHADKIFGVSELVPAGVFYAPLRPRSQTASSRAEALDTEGRKPSSPYQHSGRFDVSALPQLDSQAGERGTQFKYAFKNDGELAKIGNDAMPSSAFAQLLDRIEETLRQHGQQIFEGVARAAPYRKGTQRACTVCACQTVCRFDPWVNPFRVLRKIENGGAIDAQTKS